MIEDKMMEKIAKAVLWVTVPILVGAYVVAMGYVAHLLWSEIHPAAAIVFGAFLLATHFMPFVAP